MPQDQVQQAQAPIDDRSPIRIGLVIGACGGLAVAIWWAAQLTSDVNTIKQQIVKFSSMDSMNQQLLSLNARMEAMERRGPEPMQLLQRQLDKVASDLHEHILLTSDNKK